MHKPPQSHDGPAQGLHWTSRLFQIESESAGTLRVSQAFPSTLRRCDHRRLWQRWSMIVVWDARARCANRLAGMLKHWFQTCVQAHWLTHSIRDRWRIQTPGSRRFQVHREQTEARDWERSRNPFCASSLYRLPHLQTRAARWATQKRRDTASVQRQTRLHS